MPMQLFSSGKTHRTDGQGGVQRRLAEIRLALGGGLVGVSVVRLLNGLEPSSSLTPDLIGAAIGFVIAWLVVLIRDFLNGAALFSFLLMMAAIASSHILTAIAHSSRVTFFMAGGIGTIWVDGELLKA